MDKVTPNDLMTFLWVGAAVVAFVLAIWALVEKVKGAYKPAHDLAQWQREVDLKLKNDKARIDSIEDGQKALCRGVLALLSHEISGNSVDKLKAAQSGLTEFLIDK